MKVNKNIIFTCVLIFLVVSYSFKESFSTPNVEIQEIGPNDEVAYFVSEAISGYAGGHTKNPTYQSIGTGRTGHAEAVAVYYDPQIVNFETLVDVFFGSHDPTTKNGQHPDYGSQYRSIAFYSSIKEKEIIEKAISKLNTEVYNHKIVTEVSKHVIFYKAESYHQNYEKLNPYNSYVRNVSVPRLKRFKKKFPKLLKEKK